MSSSIVWYILIISHIFAVWAYIFWLKTLTFAFETAIVLLTRSVLVF